MFGKPAPCKPERHHHCQQVWRYNRNQTSEAARSSSGFGNAAYYKFQRQPCNVTLDSDNTLNHIESNEAPSHTRVDNSSLHLSLCFDMQLEWRVELLVAAQPRVWTKAYFTGSST